MSSSFLGAVGLSLLMSALWQANDLCLIGPNLRNSCLCVFMTRNSFLIFIKNCSLDFLSI
uniref:Uncharacterized protein n=1 Tax=Solanum lycopersicum TaxID=4081 RepID=A0A3Q7HA65_SOLLC